MTITLDLTLVHFCHSSRTSDVKNTIFYTIFKDFEKSCDLSNYLGTYGKKPSNHNISL